MSFFDSLHLKAMDSSHVALVSLKLEVGLFETYRCDRTINLGMSLANMAKALKCANNDDTCLIRYEENDADSITFAFEDTKRVSSFSFISTFIMLSSLVAKKSSPKSAFHVHDVSEKYSSFYTPIEYTVKHEKLKYHK